jgi:hypothetical protein
VLSFTESSGSAIAICKSLFYKVKVSPPPPYIHVSTFEISLPDKQFSCLGVGVLDGTLYAVGGHDGPLVRKSVESYNPDTKSWIPVADMALCRRNAGMCGAIFITLL